MEYRLMTLDGTLVLDDAAGTIAMGTDAPVPVSGATASIETAGEVNRRITASRIVLTGVFALAWRKKKDDRELYVTVQTGTTTMLARVDPKRAEQSRRFTAAVNDAGAGRQISDARLAAMSKSKVAINSGERKAVQAEKYARMSPEDKKRSDFGTMIFGFVALAAILVFIIYIVISFITK